MGGADSEATLRRNRAGLDALALRQRVLVDVRKIDLGTTLLGQPLAFPVFPAPVGGFLSKVHAEGGPAVARAAVSRGTTAFIATAAKPSLEAAQAAVGIGFLYPWFRFQQMGCAIGTGGYAEEYRQTAAQCRSQSP